MAFQLDAREFRTVAAFESYLATIRPFPGACGVVEHHTYRPRPHEWHGLTSIRAIASYYAQRYGWDRGPHLFVGANGIWQMTPPTVRGIHATSANSWAVGVEHIWDGDAASFPPNLLQMSYGVTAALLRWLGVAAVGELTVIGHREVPGTTKSCPGNRVSVDLYRQGLRRFIAAQTPPAPMVITDAIVFQPNRRYVVSATSRVNIRQSYDTAAPVALQLEPGESFLAGELRPGGLWRDSNAWLWVTRVDRGGQIISQPGFVHALLAQATGTTAGVV